MTCIVEGRSEADAARRALLCHDSVWGASLLSPREGSTDAWAVELAIVTETTAADGVSPVVLQTIARHGLSLRSAQRRSQAETRVVASRE
jgi:hypothetical protein